MNRKAVGLTMIEVILAIAVLGMVLAAIATTSISGIRQNAISGGRTQAAEILNYLGRRVAAGQAGQITPLTWDYGELNAAFSEFSDDGNFANPDHFRAEVRMLDPIGIGLAQMVHYNIEVCWKIGDGENCLLGDTAGPPISGTTNESLPGIN